MAEAWGGAGAEEVPRRGYAGEGGMGAEDGPGWEDVGARGEPAGGWNVTSIWGRSGERAVRVFCGEP